MNGEHTNKPAHGTEDRRNIEVLRMHAGICSKAVKVEIEGPALKEQAKIFNGAADTIQRLLRKIDSLEKTIERYAEAAEEDGNV